MYRRARRTARIKTARSGFVRVMLGSAISPYILHWCSISSSRVTQFEITHPFDFSGKRPGLEIPNAMEIVGLCHRRDVAHNGNCRTSRTRRRRRYRRWRYRRPGGRSAPRQHTRRPRHYGPSPVYVAPDYYSSPSVYPAPVYSPDCYCTRSEPYWDDDREVWIYPRTRVCE
jgi:hypothetical protein